ncbi:tyrosine-protein phosphatase non-receptor type 2 isoform X2 [Anthonomus grandis grandis]|uniref:tyrosine-protein phosphatase non-receptor type 2 isoform X2 n=1 Tax=Anthonomus grandis grandis TaxID=2921223 RepID=UPI00216609A1|nr:tyrosine-protein phosphatase non-receptor type 2 isoform X2 [Anthonomus grandis grandis]
MSTEVAPNNIETEFLELNSKDDWPAFYQKIRAKSIKLAGPCLEALKPQNKNLNRYRDVHPYDHSRIILQRGSTDYINANLCKVEKANRKYILTQGPLSNTVSHFWLMIWEQQSKAVLMLNKLIEKRAEKCFQYWPSNVGSKMTFNDVGLSLEYLEQQDHSYYLTRILRLTDIESGHHRDILQFHYITWPDFGVPCSPTKFLDFLKKVRKAGVLEDNVGPPVVHCSAGIGRSGTFCLVDSCLVLIEKYGLNSVNVEEILLELRKYRTGLIQTAEQLRFSYQAIIEGAKQLLNHVSDDDESSEGKPNNHLIQDGGELIEEANTSSEEDEIEPPPLPPPRIDSLAASAASQQNGLADKPLPTIPQSVSYNDFTYKGNGDENGEERQVPSGPLPNVPTLEEGSSEDSLEEESDADEEDEPDEEDPRVESPSSDDGKSNSAEIRHRRRVERKNQLEKQVRDMKRRQQSTEQWQQLKRSLYVPLLVGGAAILLGGGLAAYFYINKE